MDEFTFAHPHGSGKEHGQLSDTYRMALGFFVKQVEGRDHPSRVVS